MSGTILPLFRSHPRSWRENRYVYPVISRRSGGLSIGINLNPDKVCNFDCVYCSVDRREPAVETARAVDLEVVEAELRGMLDLALGGELYAAAPFDQTPEKLRRLNDIAFSGDGEPTAYPGFEEAAERVVGVLRERGIVGVQPIVITNATLLDRAGVRRGIDALYAMNGRIWAKLDAGTQGYYEIVERTAIPLRRVLKNILAAGLRWPIVIQSMFIRMDGREPSEAERGEYVARLAELKAGGCGIEYVQLYTLARAPAEANVSAVGEELLEGIARGVRGLGIEARVYPGA
jgi:wyosine [tRNA(Phe)-imidazoG37] synthetase (radical SAM superfamily)